MYQYVTRRLLQLVPTLFGMSLLIFLMVRLLPGDVVNTLFRGESHLSPEAYAAIRKSLGLGDPGPIQYLHWVQGLVTGNLGNSLVNGVPVSGILGRALPITLELGLLAAVIATLVGIPLGVVSAARPNSPQDFAARTGGLIGLSIPEFWLATMVLLFTSLYFQWVPPVIWIPFFDDPVGNLGQIIIPASALAVYMMATVMRMTRTAMLEVLKQDYVRTARAKGVPMSRVIYRHALRNALIPVVTVIGFQVGSLMSGATILETIFGLPGIGYTLTHSIYNRDYPVVQDAALILAVIFVFINLAVDLLYGIIDPRISQT